MAIKHKISSLVKKQLPEFIREDYQTFAAFIQAYYEFLEQNNMSDITKYRDIDETLESFVEQFRKELAGNLPNVLSDKRFVLQKMKDQYLSKGTESSYRLLFRLLFDKEISIDYPSRQLLKASDGRWTQDYSIFVQLTRGSPEDILGKVIQVITPVKNVDVRVDNYRYATITTDGVAQISDTIVELFIDKKYFGIINYNYIVQYGATFEGVILPTTSNVTIVTPGQDFAVGDLHYIKSASGEGSLIKVTRIDDNGGILNAQFIKFGLNYGSDFTTIVAPKEYSAAEIPVEITSTPSGLGTQYNIAISDSVYSIVESGLINEFDYAADIGTYWVSNNYYSSGAYVFYDNRLYQVTSSGTTGTTAPVHVSGSASNGTATLLYVRKYGAAWDGGYSGELLREFYVDNSNYLNPVAQLSQIKVTLGAVAKYPGYYSDNLGFISDAIYIQDGRYYQAYSYVIKIDERLDSYKNAVKSLLHPAGMALFGEYELKNEFDVGVQLESLIKFSRYFLEDSVGVTDDNPLVLFIKEFIESISVTETTFLDISKFNSDSFSLDDDGIALTSSKLFSEETGVEDSTPALTTTKSLLETTTIADAIQSAFTKVNSDTQTITDVINLFVSYIQSYSDTTTISESHALTTNKVVTPDSVVLSDASSFSFGKSSSDFITLSDNIQSAFTKVNSDAPTITDLISLFITYGLLYSDTATISESCALTTNKVVTPDSVVLSDASSFVFGQTNYDTVLSADLISTINVNKTIDESAVISDYIITSANYVKSFDDSFSLTDALGFSSSITLSDSFTTIDSLIASYYLQLDETILSADLIQSFAITKGLSDSAVLTDSFALSSNISFYDSFTVVDLDPEVLEVLALQDQVSITDSEVLDYTAQFSETQLIGDVLQFVYSRIDADSVTTDDNNTLNISKLPSDTPVVADSGVIELNPYVVAGYISTTDYVQSTSQSTF